MKHITHLLLLVICAWCLPAHAQRSYKVHFAHGTEIFPENFDQEKNSTIPAADISEGYFTRYVQFNELPSTQERKAIEGKGVKFGSYVNFGTYLMQFPKDFKMADLSTLNARSIMKAQPRWKMHRNLVERPFGDWAVHGQSVDVVVQLFSFVSIERGAELLGAQRYTILQKGTQNGVVNIRIPQDQIDKVAALPYIKWMELMPEPPKKDDLNGRSLHRANLLDSDHPLGKKYNGEGVNVLVRDDGAVGPHIDFQGRLYNQNGTGEPLAGTHGDGVAGIIGGAGNLDPTKKGMAAGSDVYVVDYVNSFQDATLPLFQDQNVTITNSSYSDGCNAGYTTATQTVDAQMHQNPGLIHVFSAGNSNNADCGYGAGTQWGNITGGHKMAKNAIATANLRVDAAIEPSSSRGPAYDGRLKPDISAHGADQNSTDPNNSYQVFGGTSAAAPGIAGCLAQLTHAYRTINGVAEAPTALLKLAMLTTANEMGNVGPDFIFGWGHVNNFRALNLLENHRYTEGTVENNAVATHTVTIPSQTRQAKLMIYWTEPPADENAARALINDLDLTVVGPDGTVYQPWKLDPTPNAAILATPAGKGRDSLNNMEQVAIDVPAAGTYTVQVKGFEVPMGPQPYYLAWEFLNDRVQLTYPAGGEGFVPGSKEWIRWDAYGNTDPFSLRYSVDGGASFTTIAGNLTNATRMYEWTVPATTSSNVKLMVVRGIRRDTTDFPLSIVAQPQNLQVAKVCPDSVTLKWNKLNNDTVAYDLYVLGQKYMEIKGTSPANVDQYQVPITDATQESWFSVRASTPSGLAGRRVNAIRWDGGLLSCPQPFDVALKAVLSPGGDAIVACGASVKPVTIRVANEGQNTITGATASYIYNGQPAVVEALPEIPVGDSIDFTFTTPITFNQNGTATLEILVNLANDDFAANNDVSKSYVVVAESANSAFSAGFESALPNGWNIISPDDPNTWEVTATNVTGSNGLPTKAVFMSHFTYSPGNGEEDYLYMIPLDLSNMADPTLLFDYAHARYDDTYEDGMRVDAFPNCDLNATPVVLWERMDPAGFETTPPQTSPFSPNSATQWKKEAVSLADFAGGSVVIRFTSINGFGNNTYLDNIGIDNIQPVLPVAQFTAPDTICRLDTLIFVAEPVLGGSPTYTWSFGSTAQPQSATGPGPHSVVYPLAGNRSARLIVSNPFGIDTLIRTFVVRNFPVSNFTQVANGLEVAFNNTSTNADTYLWDFGDGNTSTLEDPTHTYAAAGTYTVVLNATSSCRTVEKTTSLTLTSGTIEQTGLSAVNVLPNPNNGRFEVVIANKEGNRDTRLQLLDMSGRLIHERNLGWVGQGTQTVLFHDLELAAGTYQLNVVTDKGTASLLVVVQ